MAIIGGFAWLGVGVPVAILIGGVWVGNRIEIEDRSRKAAVIQLELARASLPAGELKAGAVAGLAGEWPRLSRGGDPRIRSEVLADSTVSSRTSRGSSRRATWPPCSASRNAALALPATDAPLDLSDHETWLLRQICIDYLPGALEHYIALPADLASEPVLDGRSAREVLDEQLGLIERRLDPMATRTYRREAGACSRTRGRRRRPSPGPVPGTARGACRGGASVGAGRAGSRVTPRRRRRQWMGRLAGCASARELDAHRSQ